MRLEFRVPVILIKENEFFVGRVSSFDASLRDCSAVNYSLFFQKAISRTFFFYKYKLICLADFSKIRFPPQLWNHLKELANNLYFTGEIRQFY